MSWIAICASEDGAHFCRLDGDRELEKWVREMYPSGVIWRKDFGKYGGMEGWDDREVMLIKGEVVVPRPAKVVERWDFAADGH